MSSKLSFKPYNYTFLLANINCPPRPHTTPFPGLLTNLLGVGSSPSYEGSNLS